MRPLNTNSETKASEFEELLNLLLRRRTRTNFLRVIDSACRNLLYIHIYIYFFSFSPYNYGGTYHFVNFIADFDECAQDTHNCSRENATCTNTEGLFNCSCDPGFSGDGHNCAGVRIF